jgi:hypothetical protein
VTLVDSAAPGGGPAGLLEGSVDVTWAEGKMAISGFALQSARDWQECSMIPT